MRAVTLLMALVPLACAKPAPTTSSEESKVSQPQPAVLPDELKADRLEAPWTELVTLKAWDAQGKKFLNERKGLKAYRREDGSQLFICIQTADILGTPTIKSEITDKDGSIYIVSRVDGDRPARCCSVTQKP